MIMGCSVGKTFCFYLLFFDWEESNKKTSQNRFTFLFKNFFQRLSCRIEHNSKSIKHSFEHDIVLLSRRVKYKQEWNSYLWMLRDLEDFLCSIVVQTIRVDKSEHFFRVGRVTDNRAFYFFGLKFWKVKLPPAI